jgi:hypothetical protein
MTSELFMRLLEAYQRSKSQQDEDPIRFVVEKPITSRGVTYIPSGRSSFSSLSFKFKVNLLMVTYHPLSSANRNTFYHL